jgi:hypothetical protein
MSTTSTVNGPARSMVWHLEAGGWTEREAGNLVALAHGLKPARSGWSFGRSSISGSSIRW